MKKSIVSAALALGLVFGATGCGHGTKMMDVPEQPLVEKKTQEDVYKAIMSATIARGWSARKVAEGLIEATYMRRNVSATVTIKYSAMSYDIEYKDSEGLKYDPESQTIHKTYNRWIMNLKQAINKALIYGGTTSDHGNYGERGVTVRY